MIKSKKKIGYAHFIEEKNLTMFQKTLRVGPPIRRFYLMESLVYLHIIYE